MPPFPALQSDYPPEPLNLDNSGRVLGWQEGDFSVVGTQSPLAVMGSWKLPASDWCPLEGNLWGAPVLTETGLILATLQVGLTAPSHCYAPIWQCNPPAKLIPFVQGSTSIYGDYRDANADGWIVGGEASSDGDFTATLYDRKTNETQGLATHFDWTWKPVIAVGISDKRIIGVGFKSGQTRGWLLDMSSPHRNVFKKRFPDWATIDWRAVYLPDLYLPNPPSDELLRELFQAMTPEDQKRALAEVQALSASVKRVEKALQESLRKEAP